MKADNSNFHLYNSRLQPNANSLRKTMTKAECCLWKYILKDRQMKGYSFRRQRPVLNYIADFMCKPLMLIVEVDGITHSFDGAVAKDNQRDEKLMEAGFTVLRFDDEEVLENIDGVFDVIWHWIEEKERGLQTQPAPPPPSHLQPHPPPAGDITPAVVE